MFRLRLLRAGVSFGVDDGVFNAGGVKCAFKEATIVGFPARG